jgi:hypothetical protein
VEKFSEAFKATVAVFHGIIATWLFVNFSERKVDEFFFVILLVFFTVANILIWKAALAIGRRIGRKIGLRTSAIERTVELQPAAYRSVDVIALTFIAIVVGLLAAYSDREDIVLRLADSVVDWQRTSSESPFDQTMLDITEHLTASVDKRSRRLVDAAREDGTYLRVYIKETKLGYEGYPGRTSTKGDKEQREIVLTPACRFALDNNDPTKVVSMQRIEGPGVFLQLADVTAIEIIDVYQSACAKLP